MTIQVRAATADDLAGIRTVFLDCWQGSYPGLLPSATVAGMDQPTATELWQRALASSATTLVAEAQGQIVGVVKFAAQAPSGAVHSLYVSPDQHGRGIGSQLLDQAVAAVAAAGCTTVTLWVFEANLPAREFYRRQGWTPDGATRVEPEFGAPEVRLERRVPRSPVVESTMATTRQGQR